MKLILISDPSSIHTRNWIDGLEANGVDVGIVFIKDWILRKGELPRPIAKKTTLIETPSFTGLVGSSIKDLSLGGVVRDLRNRTRLHQTIRFAGQRIKEIAKGRDTDIIHAHGLASSLLLAHSSGMRPYTASAWGSDIYVMPDRYPYLKPLMSRAILDAAFIHVESEISGNRVKELSSDSFDKMLVSTWGVDTDDYRPNMTDSNFEIPQNFILSFRSLEPVYRVNVIIEAFRILVERKKEVSLVIGGDGSAKEDLEKLSKDLGIADRVKFTGFIEADEKRLLFSNALLYVQCPETDGVSLAMMEAMSSGLPLVSSDVGETSVLIQPEENGYLVDDPTPDNLAGAMLRILSEDSLRTRMGVKSREIALEHHDRSIFFQNFVRSVKVVLGS